MEHWERHKAWHKEKDAETAALISNSEFMMAQERRDADEKLAAATDEYERLVAQADQRLVANDFKAAMKLAKKAIELDLQRPGAYFVLAGAYAYSGDHLARVLLLCDRA